MTACSKLLRRINNQSAKWRENYEISGDYVTRKVILSDSREMVTQVKIDANADENEDAQSLFDYSFLRLKEKPRPICSGVIAAADLFCGCGGLSLGALQACIAIGKRFMPLVAIDNDVEALAVYKRNFGPAKTYPKDISAIVDGSLGSEPTISELQLQKDCLDGVEHLDLLLAGSPCQGYSSLNNYTRQDDDSNVLYERVARFVELVKPKNVLIENVPAVLHSKEKVVEKVVQLMKAMGYFVDSGVVNLATMGVPQLRRRHIVVASEKNLSIQDVVERHAVKRERTVAWAIEDLQDEPATGLMACPTRHSEENLKRIRYLHLEQIYDLPNELRPRCHQKKHGYKSMYGRMKFDQPAQTITSGFPSPGQGRFVHPTRMRTITPHEAARLQFFPDYFDFADATTRRSLALMIGNAVPMKLSYAFCLELLA